jgi:hypothetical protein
MMPSSKLAKRSDMFEDIKFYALAILVVIVSNTFSAIYFFRQGFAAGQTALESEIRKNTDEQRYRIESIMKQVRENEKAISDIDDECLDRMWSDELIRRVNLLP